MSQNPAAAGQPLPHARPDASRIMSGGSVTPLHRLASSFPAPRSSSTSIPTTAAPPSSIPHQTQEHRALDPVFPSSKASDPQSTRDTQRLVEYGRFALYGEALPQHAETKSSATVPLRGLSPALASSASLAAPNTKTVTGPKSGLAPSARASASTPTGPAKRVDALPSRAWQLRQLHQRHLLPWRRPRHITNSHQLHLRLPGSLQYLLGRAFLLRRQQQHHRSRRSLRF